MLVTIYGDSASVQAATRVNAEQASKMSMRRPTRKPYRGRLTRLGKRADEAPSRCAGAVAAACTQRKKHATREAPRRAGGIEKPEAREGSSGRCGVTERLVVLVKPGNAGGGKGPWFRTDATRS